MSRLMATAGARTRTFLAASAVGMLVLIGLAALVVAQSLGGVTPTSAETRARQGADLLVTIGVELPSLTPAAVAGDLPGRR